MITEQGGAVVVEIAAGQEIAAITLGGLGSAFGALIGGIFIGIFVEMSSLYFPSELKAAPALFILIVVLIVRPQGILGKSQRVG